MRRPLACLALGALIASPRLPATGPDHFFEGLEALPVEGRLASLVVADLNGDGLPDVAAVEPEASLVHVLLDGLDATFGTPVSYPAGQRPVFIQGGDLDGDGDTDLLTVGEGSSTVSVLLNGGDGTIGEALATPAGPSPRHARLADLDGDSRLDVVVANALGPDDGDLTILLGDGRGAFSRAPGIRVGETVYSILVDDFNQDGRLDIAATHWATHVGLGALGFYAGLGDGRFEPPVNAVLDVITRAIPVSAQSADFDDDGRTNVAVMSNGAGLYLFQFLESDWTNEPPVVPDAPGGGLLRAADLDGDALPDLAYASYTQLGQQLQILRGTGDGGFEPPAPFLLGVAEVLDLDLADVDGDGDSDAMLSVATRGFSGLACLRGKGSTRFPAQAAVSIPGLLRGIVALDPGAAGAAGVLAVGSRTLYRVEVGPGGTLESTPAGELRGKSLSHPLAADFDGDGSDELAAADIAGGKGLLVFFEGGGAARTVEHGAGNAPGELAAADFDGDGALDLVVTDALSSMVTLILQPGTAPARTLAIDVDSPQGGVACGDFDADGAADLAVAAREDLRVLFGDGNGGFPRTRMLEELKDASLLRAGDLDSSGVFDLVLETGAGLEILHAVGLEDDFRRMMLVDRLDALAVELRDLDGDGKTDIVAAKPGEILALQGRGRDGFEPPGRHAVGDSPAGLVLVDMDGDGLTDCIYLDLNRSAVCALRGASRGAPPPFLRGDANGDGKVDLSDAVATLGFLFLGTTKPGCLDAADADDSGNLQITDPIFLLGALFLGAGKIPEPYPGCGAEAAGDLLGCSRGCP